MSGQGASGPIGPTGPTGMTGRKGRQGPPVGPTGAGLYSYLGRLTLNTTALSGSTSSLGVSTSDYSTYYSMTTSATSINLTLPASATPGAFFVFRNNTASTITFTLTGGAVAVYSGNATATSIPLASTNSVVFVADATSLTYIVV
jgi:hypothetical protein